MNGSLITTVVPFAQGRFTAVNAKIRQLSEQADVTKRLDDDEFVHFLSIVAVGQACPSEDWAASQGNEESLNTWEVKGAPAWRRPNDHMAHILVEVTVDGSIEEATARLVAGFGSQIVEVLAVAEVWPETFGELSQAERDERLRRFLLAHHCPIRAGWTWPNWLRRPGRKIGLGQTHVGSPGMTVWRIRRERDLSQWIDRCLQDLRHVNPTAWESASPIARLNMVRDRVWRGAETGAGDAKWAFSAESAPCLPADPANQWNDSGYDARNPQAVRAFFNIVHGFAWPFYFPLAVLVAALAWFWAGRKSIDFSTSLLVGSVVLWGAVAAFLWIRRGRAWEINGAIVAMIVALWLGWVWHKSEDVFNLVVFALPKSVAVLLLVVGVVVFGLYRRLRRLEAKDSVESKIPPSPQIEALMNQENRPHCVQNHMATVSRLKPGLLRRLTLRLAFLVVGTGHLVGRPGFLGKNGVIHAARWMRLPGTSLLMFWSNFDGTWESYVADFIADAPTGVTAIWSNCVGFPRTRGLFTNGAEDRDQLIHWARRQQQPTLFWYSAYRDLTTDRIRTNAAIRQGLASAASDADARDWLSLFGSSQRPPGSLDATEIPTLIFGGLSTRPFACMLLIRLHGQPEQTREWLQSIEQDVTYGEARPGRPAVVLGLAASALAKLEVPEEACATFPNAFQQGMWQEWRSRALGDLGDNAPEYWRWGGKERTQPDATLILYAYSDAPSDDSSLTRLIEHHRTVAGRHDATVFEEIRLDPPDSRRALGKTAVPPELTSIGNGSFGFADGISQPVIRGAPRTGGSAVVTDLVHPGELVLGYPDNTERLPPSPLLLAKHDPRRYLPNAGTDPSRRRPEFSRYEPQAGERDLGANGTFLVVRQLREEEGAFDAWCRDTYQAMKADVAIDFSGDGQDATIQSKEKPNTEGDPGNAAAEMNKQRLIASLLVGRWPDGSSLVRNPRSPATTRNAAARPDNAFRYGLEDPRGFACPFGAHTRRANPRDTRFHESQAESDTEIDAVNRHRILRVGRSYGRLKESSMGKGLMFMCLNADIERQFEFVQKTWLLNPNIHGLQNEVDPLLGRGNGRSFTVPSPAGPVSMPLRDFVRVVGGAYFFLPGRATLRYLAHENGAICQTQSQLAPSPPGLR